jgi:hypothetical protein
VVKPQTLFIIQLQKFKLMKTITKFSLLFLFTFSITAASFAQKGMKNGSVTYEMSMEEDNPMAGMLQGTQMKFHFKGKKVKTEMNMMGGMVNMNVIMDNEAQNGVMLMSAPMMGKNMAVELTKEEMEKMKEEQKVNQKKPKIEYFKNKKKKIAGYKCYKVVATLPGVDEPITLYVTDKIKPEGQSQIQQQIAGLEGFPLSYEISQQGMKMIFTATEVSTDAPKDSEFDMTIPEGFEKVTLEELGGMGGMGFGM